MDFLTNFFTLPTIIYAVLGIPALLGFVILVRLSRQGRSNFTERHKAMDLRIQQTTSEMEELNKTMLQSEQLHIVATALREAIQIQTLQAQRRATNPPVASVEEYKDAVILHLEKHIFLVEYKEKKQFLRSTGKIVYGQGHFEVYGPLGKEHVLSSCPKEDVEEHAPPTIKKVHSPPSSPNTTLKGEAKIFYSLLELELYLTQKMQSSRGRLLPPALRMKK